MEIKKHLQEATHHMSLPMTSREVEPYVLTEYEEQQALEYAIFLYAKKLKHPVLEDRIERAKAVYATPAVRNKLLAECNSNKLQQLWHEQQRKKRLENETDQQKELIKKCDANYFYNVIKKQSDVVKFKRADANYIKILCFFFSSDKRFETELGFDLKKGLWIRGLAGRGKTFPLQCLQQNPLKPFKIHSMLQVAEIVKETGDYEIKSHYKVIDDVDTEEKWINHYGTRINWFKKFLELYYLNQDPFNRLIVTTNSDFEMIENSYGFRVRSRIKDVFNIVDVMGEDLRGKI